MPHSGISSLLLRQRCVIIVKIIIVTIINDVIMIIIMIVTSILIQCSQFKLFRRPTWRSCSKQRPQMPKQRCYLIISIVIITLVINICVIFIINIIVISMITLRLGGSLWKRSKLWCR